MVHYRRVYLQGGCYFFTLTLKDRQAQLLTENVDSLRNAFSVIKQRRPFLMPAIVVLPEHLHCLWRLPRNDADYSGRWRAIKSLFTRELKKKGVVLHKNPRGEYDLWQRRYWEHAIRDRTDFERHIEYIHFNPVKHGYVSSACQWPYSSFHRFVTNGWLPRNWGADYQEHPGLNWGE